MNEIATIADTCDEETVEDDLFFFSLKSKTHVWYVKLSMPDGSKKYYRYAKGLRGNLTGDAKNKRREIIQERVNELAQQGFSVPPKYISLFMSGKVKELILERKHQKQKRQQHVEVKAKNEKIEEMEDGDDSLTRLMKNYMQRSRNS
jgi:hypothetical protein